MLQSRNLDDQSYEQLLQAAVSRLPVLCTEWTDRNEADPGITLLELFSWYQEMQRYQLNRVTKSVRRAMLNFLGITPREARAAECFVQVPTTEGVLPEGTRLATKEKVNFELQEAINGRNLEIARLLICRSKEEPVDITEILRNDAATVHPFNYGNQKSTMEIYFDGNIDSELRVWFDVAAGEDCVRTPFRDEEQVPRVIRWKWNGEIVEPSYDQTHALSVSGFIGFPTDAANGGVLSAELVDPGCEERVRLRGIFCNRYRVLQQETKSKVFPKIIPQNPSCVVEVANAMAFYGTVLLFLRTQNGWIPVEATSEELTRFGEKITLDSSDAVCDGDPNLWVVFTVLEEDDKLWYASTGLPNQVIAVHLYGKEPVGDFSLICNTLDENGEVHPQIWHRVNDMSVCGPRDRVFLYDSIREEITFGDGQFGDIVPAGQFALTLGDVTLSDCDGGNIPGGSILYRVSAIDTGEGFLCTEGVGGMSPESIDDTEARFLKKISQTKKCATVDDYCRIAKQTPGLRVAKVRALPGFDPKEMNSKVSKPIVSVVVVPYSQDARPMPDQRFLDAVSYEMEKCRPICTKVKVLPPRYVEVGLQVRLQAEDTLEEKTVRDAMEAWFSMQNPKRDIGSAVLQNEISLCLQRIPGVLLVNQVHLYSRVVGCRVTTEGNLVVPPDAITWLKEFQLEIHE